MEPALPSPSPSPPSPSVVPPLDARGRDRLIGLFIVAVAFALCLALSFWAKEKSQPETSEPPGPPTVDGVVGFPKAVDAVATLAGARKVTRRTMLRGIVLDGVLPDGTIDLSQGGARVRYTFQSGPGQGAQPPREPGTLPKRITCGKQNVIVTKHGLVAEPDESGFPCPPGGVEPLPEPQCSVKDVWRAARRRKISREQPAHIEYYRSRVGPAWRFESGKQASFSLYGDCKRELTASEAHGSVP